MALSCSGSGDRSLAMQLGNSCLGLPAGLDSGFQFAQGSEELVAFGFDLDQFLQEAVTFGCQGGIPGCEGLSDRP
jgi:hypothetical protein